MKRFPAPPPYTPRNASVPSATIQRAITVGMNPVPRTSSLLPSAVDFLQKQGVYDAFAKLNDDRQKIYIYSSEEHLLNHLKILSGQTITEFVLPPFVHEINQTQLNQGHSFAQDVRFTTIYQPGTHQISQNAPGTHTISNDMMPPSGINHHWGQSKTTISGENQYTIYQNQFQTSQPTLPLTYGDPQKPSLIMNQGGINLGMHITPTYDSTYVNEVDRDDTRYAQIVSVTDRVRGHPFALKQSQISTDDSDLDFDGDSRAYTDESDSTKDNGGVSSWRYNEVENKSIKSGLSFTQINNNPVLGPMGISRPSTMSFRRETTTTGVYDDFVIDNTGTTDYRNVPRPKGIGKQAYQTQMGRDEAQKNPYLPPSIHHQGDDFTDTNRYSYPGYMSPPPTPFLSDDTLSDEIELILPIEVRIGSRVKNIEKEKGRDYKGYTGIVTDILDHDKYKTKARCLVKVFPPTSWPSTFK